MLPLTRSYAGVPPEFAAEVQSQPCLVLPANPSLCNGSGVTHVCLTYATAKDTLTRQMHSGCGNTQGLAHMRSPHS
jgi:hypothetical protein